jgi:hypothetical protein
MDLPPKIIEAREVPVEVLPPISATVQPREASEGPPIHALSALLLVTVDNLWNLTEWVVVDWVVTIPLSFLSVFIPVFFLQKHLKKDTVGRAMAIALLLGVLAAVPTSITGTPIGLALLAWSGLSKVLRLGCGK